MRSCFIKTHLHPKKKNETLSKPFFEMPPKFLVSYFPSAITEYIANKNGEVVTT